MKSQQRFAEIEYCLEKYFQANLAPVMSRVQRDLTKKQLDEYSEYKSTFAGIMADLSDASTAIPGLDTAAAQVRQTGTWSNRTIDDYMLMCQTAIASDKTLQKDLQTLSAEWRTAVVSEIGRVRYDQLSKQLGCDLAYAYVDYRIRQQMVKRMTDKHTPKNTADYIMRKAATGSLIGIGATMQQSPLAREISDKAEKAYKPTTAEKATARVASFGVDAVTTGCIASWASIGKFAAMEITFDGVEWALGKANANQRTITVEQCISQAVFNSQSNVFTQLHNQSKKLKPWDNDHIKSIDRQLSNKTGAATSKPAMYDIIENQRNKAPQFTLTGAEAQSRKQSELRKSHDVPSIIALGKEEEYIKDHKDNNAKTQEKAAQYQTQAAAQPKSDETTAAKEPAKTQDQTDTDKVQNPTNDNSIGWGTLLETVGLNGLGDIGHNLGYVISMLPDILVGMWTGKTKSLDLKDNLVPYASVLAGMFVKNPIMKMLLIGMGGANLLNKAGHEALGKADGASQHATPHAAKPQYLHYDDQPLNLRITDVTLRGSTLTATIDKVPCAVRLTQDIVDACRSGALPLNTLANTILERNEQRQAVMDNNYERLQEQQRQQQVAIK
jgi:hypothetical protein